MMERVIALTVLFGLIGGLLAYVRSRRENKLRRAEIQRHYEIGMEQVRKLEEELRG